MQNPLGNLWRIFLNLGRSVGYYELKQIQNCNQFPHSCFYFFYCRSRVYPSQYSGDQGHSDKFFQTAAAVGYRQIVAIVMAMPMNNITHCSSFLNVKLIMETHFKKSNMMIFHFTSYSFRSFQTVFFLIRWLFHEGRKGRRGRKKKKRERVQTSPIKLPML